MKTDHFKMLRDVEELNHLFSGSQNIDSFLSHIVEMVSQHMHTAVSSIYIYDEKTKTLEIKANIGLNQETYRNVKLKLGEGLVGKSLQELRPLCLTHASKSPEFKFFPNLNEEAFDSFLAVPIRLGMNRIGVLVVQRSTENPFNDNDVSVLTVIASQLASIISHVHAILSIQVKAKEKIPVIMGTEFKFIKGKVASGGYAFSRSVSLCSENPILYFTESALPHNFSINDFYRALKDTQEQLESLQKKIEEKLSDVASLIFTAHLLILKDRSFIGKMESLIKNGAPVANAILTVAREYIDAFDANPNPIFKEKKHDIEDLLIRIMNNLLQNEDASTNINNHIVIARELYPSDMLKMSSENVQGIILISGGVTSHVSILARSLNIPLVIADIPELLLIPNGTPIIIDAENGNVYLNPTPDVITEFEKQKPLFESLLHNKELIAKDVFTRDGLRVNLMANINLLSDLSLARECRSDGIGLYRTEFPFIIRTDFPTEEEQYVIYRKLVLGMPDKPITFRTLDIGGDKLLTYYAMNEHNPFLGFRSIRFSLKHPEVFIQQIRAILRAGVNASIRIMFPMISSIDELIAAKGIVSQCLSDLDKEGIEHNAKPHIGIMIEIPSIIFLLEDIAPEVDFFSVGTNDLIQFFLAVDRTNEKVASFYTPAHPSILRSLKKIADIAKKTKTDLSLCGDMAHDPLFVPFLLGIGIHTLSIDSQYLPRIKQTILNVEHRSAKALAEHILTLTHIDTIKTCLKQYSTEIIAPQ
jgi:phosphotransferase system enzyme I (PtsP)